MPSRNIYHDTVIRALIVDGWTITDDPLRISYGGRDLYVDLGAERPTIAAEKAGQRIAVEVASFLSQSPIHDLQEVIGQFEMYRAVLKVDQPDRVLFLAVPQRVQQELLGERFGQLMVGEIQLRYLIFDEEKERILQWKN